MAVGVKIKKAPERKCVGCSNCFPKKELIRVVRDSEGSVSLDFTGKKAGRGAYLCKNLSCFKKAQKAKRFESNLECTIPEEVYEALSLELAANESK
ncbi:MAG: YlxR family protein [Clostridia bacterium]|nr:YlxR family protein [Clostridia bacterium]